MKKEYDIIKKNICIKIPVKEDKKFKEFTLENSLYRNKVRNAFVEEANKYTGEYNMYDGFSSWKYHTQYYNEVEKPNNIYYTKCIGISEQVSQDIKRAIKAIRTKNRKAFNGESHANLGKLNFKRFDPNRYSFKVHINPTLYTTKDGTIKSREKLKILSNNELIFKVRNNVPKEFKESLYITLKESLYDDIDGSTFIRYYNNGYINECRFTCNDIKEISFMYELGNYYIQLSINVEYYISYINKKSKAGIDTGIHNPAILFDGNTSYVIRYDDKMSNKLHYLERRMRRLQHILNKKVKGSNNYNKILYKIRKIHKKIFNIKRDWRYKTCKDIVIRYNKICVDTFEQPDNKDKNTLPNKIKRTINFTNRFHCMYYFNNTLRYMADKYGCKYIESPKDTTRTCSCCGHVNDHLLLSERYLICKKCGIKIDRDVNAAQNCYAFIA